MNEVTFYRPGSKVTPNGQPLQTFSSQGKHWFLFVQIAGMLGFTHSRQDTVVKTLNPDHCRSYYTQLPEEGRKRFPIVYVTQEEVRKMMDSSPLTDKQSIIQWLETIVFPWLERGEASQQFMLTVGPFRWHSK